MGGIPAARIAADLRGQGLWFDVGLATIRLRSDVASLAAQVQRVYGHFPHRPTGTWADLHIDLKLRSGWRRFIRPQVSFYCDGQQPFDPFPADTGLPLFEWGANWLIGRRMNQVLLLHAGVVERDGLALIMPATPGSGKSTLTCALSLRGWRLMSDEFGAFYPPSRAFVPVLKPAALKNESIDVIRRFGPDAALGPEFPATRKGTVAHLRPPRDAVARVHDPASPGAIVFPRWQAGASTKWEPVTPSEAFGELAFNAFNYNLIGEAGFRSVVDIVRQCPAWRLTYSNLDDALAQIASAWQDVLDLNTNRREAAALARVGDL
jgi:HprK-related kinase A